MTNRRRFFTQLASGLIVAAAPSLFLPKIIKPAWSKPARLIGIDWAAEGSDRTVTCMISWEMVSRTAAILNKSDKDFCPLMMGTTVSMNEAAMKEFAEDQRGYLARHYRVDASDIKVEWAVRNPMIRHYEPA